MHEISMIGHVINEILRVAKENNAKRVQDAVLEVGELTLLGTQQLKFAYDILSKSEGRDMLKGSKLKIRTIKGKIKCTNCDYQGPIRNRSHISHLVPVFSCPECNGKVEIVSGRDCILKCIKLITNSKNKPRKKKVNKKRAR